MLQGQACPSPQGTSGSALTPVQTHPCLRNRELAPPARIVSASASSLLGQDPAVEPCAAAQQGVQAAAGLFSPEARASVEGACLKHAPTLPSDRSHIALDRPRPQKLAPASHRHELRSLQGAEDTYKRRPVPGRSVSGSPTKT